MSRIHKAFEKGKAFIPFITAGDPDTETSFDNICAAVENGADLVEIGIPFSDPTAEGPVIQAANVRALSGGFTTDRAFELVEALRKETDVPFVFMTYANVVYSRGIDSFAKKCADCGIDGIILPDVPFEERSEFSRPCSEYGVDLIPLIAPTSEDRISMIAKEASGFIYVVSSLGVTGVRNKISTDISAMTRIIRENSQVPCAVGFGISTPDQARTMSKAADGVIVGSAIIKIMEKYGKNAAPYIGQYVKEMKEAISV